MNDGAAELALRAQTVLAYPFRLIVIFLGGALGGLTPKPKTRIKPLVCAKRTPKFKNKP